MPPKIVGNDRLKRRQMKEETDEYAKDILRASFLKECDWLRLIHKNFKYQ